MFLLQFINNKLLTFFTRKQNDKDLTRPLFLKMIKTLITSDQVFFSQHNFT